MFKFNKKLLKKISGFALMNSFAFFLAANSVNLTCMLSHHQPTVPESLKKYRKF